MGSKYTPAGYKWAMNVNKACPDGVQYKVRGQNSGGGRGYHLEDGFPHTLGTGGVVVCLV